MGFNCFRFAAANIPIHDPDLRIEDFKTKLPYQIDDEYIEQDPDKFYLSFGKLVKPRQINSDSDPDNSIRGIQYVDHLTPYQYDIWKLGDQYKILVVVKPQKSGITTSELIHDFQYSITKGKGRGKDILVIGQTETHANEHIDTLKRLIASSEKYRKYLITETKELYFKEQKTKVGVIYVKNPDNPFRPSRIIGLPFVESSLWSWKEVCKIHMSDTAISPHKNQKGIYATALGRLVNTDGPAIIESPPAGVSNEFFQQYEMYKDNTDKRGHVYTVYVDDAIKYGVVTQEVIDEKKKQLGYLFGQYYGSSFISASGNVFSIESIERATMLAQQQNSLDINRYSPKFIAIDEGFQSSKFGIVIGEQKAKCLNVLHVEEMDKPTYEEALDRIFYLRDIYGNVLNIGYDSSRPELGRSLKRRIGENHDDSYVKDKILNANKRGIHIGTQMIVAPISFNHQNKINMTYHVRKMLDDPRGLVSIHPRHDKLLTALRGAIFDDQGIMVKDESPHNDIFDAFSILCDFFRFENKGEMN
mgnify:CR=1 FL=1